MRIALVFSIFLSFLWVRLANAERKLPADLQVDLIFPRNETYAPSHLLPIVFGVNNIDAVWPLDLRLSVEVQSTLTQSNASQPSWLYEDVSLEPSVFAQTVGQTPGKQFFYFPAINMTKIANGTANEFRILWKFSIPRRCFANSTDPRDDDGDTHWSNSPLEGGSRVVWFKTAPGAQRPDVQATINSCSDPEEATSTAVRVTEVRKTYSDGQFCPVLETNIKPTKCTFQSAAKELAANVSAAMLKEMGCKEGEWQTLTERCPKEENMAPSQTAALGMGSALLALAIALPIAL
ncbi:uncharacterized protein CTRU02_207797 [Colletotrichum truncatum]|uniref:Uncharacterized protein n=1 Tax=Colletotrichum truncatum TaxID=5467 RepID=A0ACC3Z1U0_COLTU|nr:uncharacterized protein CTRU02_15141 [Colletotrichum truncatum]KAF6781358.1 hypothetical protein CTRU02_15141 [Colletotrichum truncatum]